MGYFDHPDADYRARGYNEADNSQAMPGTFDGFWSGAGTGLKAGALNAANTLLTTGEMGVTGLRDALQMPGLKRTPEQENLANQFEDLKQATRANALSAVPENDVGTAGHIAYGLGKIGTEAVLSSALGVPAPIGIGLAEGIGATDRAEEQGVDDQTATRLGMISGLSNAAFASLPGSVGITKLAPDFLAAVGLNELVGVADRGANAKILDDAGYHDMANQYHLWDTEAMAVNAGLTALFHGAARHKDYGETFKKYVDTSRFMPGSQLNTALATESARHVDTHLAPGIPATPEALAAHLGALAEIDQAIAEGRLPDAGRLDLSGHVYVPNPAQTAGEQTISQALNELHAESGLPDINAPRAEPLPEPIIGQNTEPNSPPSTPKPEAVSDNITPIEILQAERLLQDHPDMTNLEDNAALVEVMREHDKDIEQAKELSQGIEAVAECALRYGA